MRSQVVSVVSAMFFAALSLSVWAVDNPAVNSSVGTGRVPLSSLQSGLVTRPNPIDRSSNRIITGQVSGGKHFRGVLPYNVESSFGGRLGSTSLDSFLRYSAGTGNTNQPTGTYEPYYSPTGTVTTMRPGYRNVIRSPSGQFRNYAIDGSVPETSPGAENLSRSYLLSDEIRMRGLRPLSMSQKEIMEIISREMRNELQAKESADEKYRVQVEEYKQKLEQMGEATAESKQTPISQEGLVKLVTKDKAVGDIVSQQSDFQNVMKQGGEDEQLDVYEQMRRRISELQKEFEEVEGGQQATETADEDKKQDSESSPLEKLSMLDKAAVAKAVLDEYDSFASYSEDKFNQYMRIAEQYLKEGKYYRAADAYTLASIYKRNDPLAYAGRSLALFAAGEYMSSALYLSRVLEIFPEYAWLKIDIVAIIGNKDLVENRIVNIERWVEQSEAGELQFLLGYFYYRMGRLIEAKDVIFSAHMKMLGSPAVVTLKKAIDDAGK